MYCVGLDLSWRARSVGLRVFLQLLVTVIHDARRASHRDPRHLVWHVRSAARYLWGEARTSKRLN